jgi:RES domain-containing protein
MIDSMASNLETTPKVVNVYRLCREEYAADLKASGRAGRWNCSGQLVLYTSESRSLAALEQLVHLNSEMLKANYCVMVLQLPDAPETYRTLQLPELPAEWRKLTMFSVLQNIGSSWCKQDQTLVLKVPSILIPQEWNYIINTRNAAFSNEVRLLGTEEFFWDNRLKK